MDQVLEVLHHVRSLPVHPLPLVVIGALLAALIEQRLTRRRTPDFSVAYRDITGAPKKPKPEPRTSPRR
jgi:hypothetical protein